MLGLCGEPAKQLLKDGKLTSLMAFRAARGCCTFCCCLGSCLVQTRLRAGAADAAARDIRPCRASGRAKQALWQRENSMLLELLPVW
jgi:hypothetical protein